MGQILDGQTDRLEHDGRTARDRLLGGDVDLLYDPRVEHRVWIEHRLGFSVSAQ
jgi:hypothetical protein